VLEGETRSLAEMLENIMEREVKSFNLYEPSLDNRYPCVPSFINESDREIFSEDSYLFEPRRSFLKGPFEFIKSRKGKTVQLLMHPTHDEGLDHDQIMCRQLCRSASRIDRALIIASRFRGFYPFGIEGVIVGSLPFDEADRGPM